MYDILHTHRYVTVFVSSIFKIYNLREGRILDCVCITYSLLPICNDKEGALYSWGPTSYPCILVKYVFKFSGGSHIYFPVA